MGETELATYYSTKTIVLYYYVTSVDYEDVANPLKTSLRFESIVINPDNPAGKYLQLKIN